MESIKRCVAANLGISYLPRFCVERELQKGALRELPLPRRSTALRLFAPTTPAKTRALRLFLDLAARPQKKPGKAA